MRFISAAAVRVAAFADDTGCGRGVTTPTFLLMRLQAREGVWSFETCQTFPASRWTLSAATLLSLCLAIISPLLEARQAPTAVTHERRLLRSCL